jgi:hypothetical protein
MIISSAADGPRNAFRVFRGCPVHDINAATAWFAELAMSALILSLSKDAGSACSAFTAVA